MVLGRLVERSDVLIESFRPGVLDRLGVGYESLRALNPRLVYCALTGYGQDGPYLLYPGHDINYIGYAGILGLSRTAEGMPVVPGIEIADMGGGMAAALGTLAALAARGVTGRGQFVDISMLDVSFSLATFRLGHALATGRSPTQVAGDPTALGYGVYETADGKYISLGAAEEKFWVTLCRLIGLEAPPQPHQLSLEERRRLNAELRRIFKSRTQAEWSALLQDKDVCYAPVLDLKEAAADPQVQERGMVFYQGTGASRLPQIGNPLRLLETPWEARTPPPGFGEHTDEVLRAVGYSEAEVQALRQRQVV